MKSGMFMCVIAMLFYALEITITDLKLTSLPPKFITACYAVGMAIFSLTTLFFYKTSIVTPDLKQSSFIFLMIVASFIAASSHFQALHQNVGTLTLTMAYSLMPVAAALFTAIFEHKFPSLQIVVAWLLGGGALYLIGTAK